MPSTKTEDSAIAPRRKYRRQQDAKGRIKHTGGNRDQRHVVGKGPEQVLPDIADRGLGQRDRGRHAIQAARHQDDIGGLDGDIGAGADGQAHIRLGQGRGVVDAVADKAPPCHIAP